MVHPVECCISQYITSLVAYKSTDFLSLGPGELFLSAVTPIIIMQILVLK
jgi:hypothetical protein